MPKDTRSRPRVRRSFFDAVSRKSSCVHAPMPFFDTYLKVTPHSRLVWTNEEAGDA
jgi:hypothetical protein